MTADPQRDDARQVDDPIDRAIDDALRAALRSSPVDLRARVLARLEEPVESSRAPRWLTLHPALVPVAGAILLAVGVTVTWQYANDRLARAGTPRPTAGLARTAPVTVPALSGTPGNAEVRAVVPTAGAGSAQPTAPIATPARPARAGRALETDTRVFAASWLAMDALGEPALAAAERVLTGDEAEPSLPGAPAGDLGDPIRPMPTPPPIVIPPIHTTPIVDAPPVSTLAQPVSTLSSSEISRDPTGPGKPGGVRP